RRVPGGRAGDIRTEREVSVSERDVVRFGPKMLARLREELGDGGERPDVSRYGVPMCSREECPEYDGKRCRILGMRPDAICEPAVMDMAHRLVAAERERAAADALADIVDSMAWSDRAGPTQRKAARDALAAYH